jgi:hypothetical protein
MLLDAKQPTLFDGSRVRELPLVCRRWHKRMADASMWTVPVLTLQGGRLYGAHSDVAKGLYTLLRRRSRGFHGWAFGELTGQANTGLAAIQHGKKNCHKAGARLTTACL